MSIACLHYPHNIKEKNIEGGKYSKVEKTASVRAGAAKERQQEEKSDGGRNTSMLMIHSAQLAP